MNTVPLQLVTIISESVVEQKLIADIKACGAKGYSVGQGHGEGVTGKHALDLNGPSIRLETVVTEKVAQAILDMLSAKYFNKYATIAWMTAAQVTRPERF